MTINVTGETITENIHNRMLKKLFKLRLNHGDDHENWPNQITTTLDRRPNYYVAVKFKREGFSGYTAAAYATYLTTAGNKLAARVARRVDFVGAWNGAVYPYQYPYQYGPVSASDAVKPFIGVGPQYGGYSGGMMAMARVTPPHSFSNDDNVVQHIIPNDPRFTNNVLATSDYLVRSALGLYGLPDVYVKRGSPLVLHDELMRCDIRLIEQHANELMNRLQESIGDHSSDEVNLYARRILEYTNRGIDKVVRWWDEKKKEMDHVSVHSPVGESEHDTNGQEKEDQYAIAG